MPDRLRPTPLALPLRWVACFMLAVDEVLPLGWFNMRPDERRWWIERAGAGSSSGRTPAFEAEDEGSTPSPAVALRQLHASVCALRWSLRVITILLLLAFGLLIWWLS